MGALDDFYTAVSRVIRRGTVYDADIPAYARDAVRTMESEHNWTHMWQESFQQTLPAADSQIVFTGDVKSARYLRFCVSVSSGTSLAGRFAYATKVQPEDIVSGLTYTRLDKVKYWWKTSQILQLDGAFTTDVLYDIGWYQFSTMYDSLPWLNFGRNVLIAQTLVEMHALLHNDKLFERAGKILARALPPMIESDLIHRFDGDDQVMTPFLDDIQENLFSDDGGLP